jgi:hypothetical protein
MVMMKVNNPYESNNNYKTSNHIPMLTTIDKTEENMILVLFFKPHELWRIKHYKTSSSNTPTSKAQ